MKKEIKTITEPKEDNFALFYSFIYKYERLNIKTLSDEQIKEHISASECQDFLKMVNNINRGSKIYSPKENNEILSLYNRSQNDNDSDKKFLFERRTKKATFLNSLLFHLRNSLAHANFQEEGAYYKIYDYSEKKAITAFGFIECNRLLQMLQSFTSK